MPREFEKVALIGLCSDLRVAEPMRHIARHLKTIGKTVLAEAEAARFLGLDEAAPQAIADCADLIIAVGGDGTMLYAASVSGDSGVPLLGINRGRLGFLTDISPDNMLTSLDQIFAGQYTIESRLRLKAELSSGGRQVQSAAALNDIVLQRRNTGRMLDFETRIAGRFVNSHMGDGLIVATPTGSTAYALSCGGPIIEPSLHAVVLVPICPHTLSDRPVVIPADHSVEIRLVERDDTNAEVVVDGHLLGEIAPDDVLTVVPCGTDIALIHPPGYDYFDILRSKLHWGRDSRKRAADGPKPC